MQIAVGFVSVNRMRIKSIRLPSSFSGYTFNTQYCEIGYVLILPIATWYLYQFSVFNIPDGFLDPWIYFGYVHNFQDLIDRYGLPYHAVRFGLIFPLIVFVRLFGPVNGYVAFVYAMYLLAGSPLYLLFRKRFSVHAAILAYAIIVSSVWFARTVLWTHPDAAAVPYLVAAAALMFLEPKHRRLASFAIGFLVALAANSNIFGLSVAVMNGVAYSIYFKNTLWNRLRQDIPWMAAGFVSIFAGGMIGYHICCQQTNFLNPTVHMIKWSIQGSGHIYQVPLSTLLKLNYLYLVPFLIFSMITILGKVDVNHRSMLLAAISYLGAAVIFYISYELFSRTAVLELFYYFSFLLAPCILCMVLIPVVLASASNSEHQLLNLALLSFLLLPLVVSYRAPASFVHWAPLCFAFTLLLILLATRFETIRAYAIVFFVLSIHISLLSTVATSSAFRADPLYMYARMYGMADAMGLGRYRLGLKFIESIPKFKEERQPVYFWFSNGDKLANSLQSTYLWRLTMVSNPEAQGLPFLNGVNLDLLHKRSWLVLFDRDSKIVDQGIDKLRGLGIRFAIKKSREICEKDVCYTIAVLNVSAYNEKAERSWQKSTQLDVVLDWGHAAYVANIDRKGTAATVTTPSKAWSYGAVVSMVFSAIAPAEPGMVRILVSVKGANAGLGFVGTNESSFIKTSNLEPSNSPQEIYFEFDKLSELRKFVIRTLDRDESAQVQVLEFSVREKPVPKR